MSTLGVSRCRHVKHAPRVAGVARIFVAAVILARAAPVREIVFASAGCHSRPSVFETRSAV